MRDLRLSMQAGASAIIATLAHIDWFFIYIYVIFMILDLLTGWYKATKNGEYSSKKMKEGLKGKVLELFIVFALLFLQKGFEQMGIIALASNVLLFGFALKEFMSIMENWTEAGKTIPKFIKNWLNSATKTFDEKNK